MSCIGYSCLRLRAPTGTAYRCRRPRVVQLARVLGHILGSDSAPAPALTTEADCGFPRNSQVLAVCITGTNTLTSLLANKGTSIPAFQTFFNYVLLNIVYTGYTIYRYGFKKWAKLLVKDGWKYFILAFLDVEGVSILSESLFLLLRSASPLSIRVLTGALPLDRTTLSCSHTATPPYSLRN